MREPRTDTGKCFCHYHEVRDRISYLRVCSINAVDADKNSEVGLNDATITYNLCSGGHKNCIK